MSLEVQDVRDDERDAFHTAVRTGFGTTRTDFVDEYPVDLLVTDRAYVVRDDVIVATSGSYSFDLTVPGAVVPVSAVTMVTVHPTHRRRGVLRQLMTTELDAAARRAEPLAVLTASEASIYERFGFGAGTFTTKWELESEHARLLHPPTTAGRMRIVDGDEGTRVATALYPRAAAQRIGELHRPSEWWPSLFAAGPNGARFFTAVHENDAGESDAFARYAIDESSPDGVPASTLRVIELQAVDAEAEAAMWSYLFGIDLIGTIAARTRPADDPLRWRLPDPRRMRVRQLRDHLWVRVLEVATALSARTYGTDDSLVLELDDEFRPENSGRWLVEGGPDGAQCARTERAGDLALSAADLGALYLGGVPASTLAAAGRVRELTTGAVARADRAFLVHPSPWCTTHF